MGKNVDDLFVCIGARRSRAEKSRRVRFGVTKAGPDRDRQVGLEFKNPYVCLRDTNDSNRKQERLPQTKHLCPSRSNRVSYDHP